MNENKPSIAALVTCHNRKEKTLRSLQSLMNQDGFGRDYQMQVFLVDDGSTDGTADAVRSKFPEVYIITGDGNLFWNRGMHLAWKTAAAKQRFDFFLLFNDDSFFFPTAVKEMLACPEEKDYLVSGATCSEADPSVTTYGGYISLKKGILKPDGTFQPTVYCNGNFLLVPYSTYEKIGMLDPVFHHALGDYDYSLRAASKGIKAFLAPRHVGHCEEHDTLSKWCRPSISLKSRLRHLYNTSCEVYPPHFFLFEKRHKGILQAMFHYCTIHIRVIIPSLWLI